MLSSDFIFNFKKNSDTVDMLSLLPTATAGLWQIKMSYEFNNVTKIAKSISNFQGDSNQVLLYLKTAFEMVEQDISPYFHVDVQVQGFPCVAFYPKKIPIDTILNAVTLLLKLN